MMKGMQGLYLKHIWVWLLAFLTFLEFNSINWTNHSHTLFEEVGYNCTGGLRGNLNSSMFKVFTPTVGSEMATCSISYATL